MFNKNYKEIQIYTFKSAPIVITESKPVSPKLPNSEVNEPEACWSFLHELDLYNIFHTSGEPRFDIENTIIKN